MSSLLLRLLSRLQPLHEAMTPAERVAVYRFRYSIYGKELRREYAGVDHAAGTLSQPEDERPETRIFYTGSQRAVTGTGRIRVWSPGALPKEIIEELSLDRVPGIERLKLAYLERVMVRPTRRGQLLLPSILWHGYGQLARAGVDVAVLTCVPGLLRHYLRLGARPYGARLIEGASSAEVPLFLNLSDAAHFDKTRSPIAPLLRAHFGPGKRAPLDPAPFTELLNPARQPFVFDPAEIVARLAQRPAMLAGVSAAALRQIARGAYLLECAEGDLIVRQGTAEREMYIVLRGETEVSVAGVAVGRIGAGEPFGEVGLLATPGVRTATVRAVAKGQLLVLRRRFLDDLAKRHPRDAFLVTRNLARLVADRFTALRNGRG